MAQLTDEQNQFLSKHKIPVSTLFDATGMSRQHYRSAMKDLGKLIAMGVTPCANGGHTLRTRAGHCLQCNTARFAFQKRFEDTADVYIAGSRKGGFLKIGVAGSATERMNSLKHLAYAGQIDWELITVFRSTKAGQIEFLAQKDVSEFAFPTIYLRDGIEVSCLETFKCSSSRALEAITKFLDKHGFQTEFEKEAFEYFDSLREAYGSFNRKGGGSDLQAKPLHKSTSSGNVADKPVCKEPRSNRTELITGSRGQVDKTQNNLSDSGRTPIYTDDRRAKYNDSNDQSRGNIRTILFILAIAILGVALAL